MYTNNVNQAHERGDPRRKEWRSEGKREKDIYMKQERVCGFMRTVYHKLRLMIKTFLCT